MSEEKTNVVFLSGWGGYPVLFPEVEECTHFIQPFADLDAEAAVEAAKQGGDVLVGWSTGAHMILKHRQELFPLYRRIILFAPFLSFCAQTPRKVVEQMIATITAEGPRRTLRAFWRNCGARDVQFLPPTEHTAQLIAGLNYLLTSFVQLTPGEDGSKMRIIHGADDRVVPLVAGSEIAPLFSGVWQSIMAFGHLPSSQLILDVLHEETGCAAFLPRG